MWFIFQDLIISRFKKRYFWKRKGTRPKANTRWWQLKHFLFSPLLGEDSNLTSIFFRWVETTNQFCGCFTFCKTTRSTKRQVLIYGLHVVYSGLNRKLILARWSKISIALIEISTSAPLNSKHGAKPNHFYEKGPLKDNNYWFQRPLRAHLVKPTKSANKVSWVMRWWWLMINLVNYHKRL